MAPNGRGQGGPQQQQAMNMLMANGMSARNLSQSQFQSFQAQNPAMQKNLQVYAQNLAQQQGRSMMNQGVSMPNGMMNPGVMPSQGSPMLGPVDGQNFMPGMSMDAIYNQQHMAALRQANMQGNNGQGGNHALHDYQMQLMLLEQQNKKRLLMARQEQDNITRTDGGPPMPGQSGMQQPGMSPGSRAGASPSSNDQIKRGTPQLGANGMPASPSGGDGMPQARGSPAGMSFAGGLSQDFNNQIFMKNMGDGIIPPSAPGMRPPTSMNPAMNLEAIARQQGGRLPGGNWQGNHQGQPMIQQPPQGQPQAMGTPQQRAGEMPPPSAPPTGSGPVQRNQPPTPPPSQAPPTPSQPNKVNPKGKKDKNEPKKASLCRSTRPVVILLTCLSSGQTRGTRPPTHPQHLRQIILPLRHLLPQSHRSIRRRSQRFPMVQLPETLLPRIQHRPLIHLRLNNSHLLSTPQQVLEPLATSLLLAILLISTSVDLRPLMSSKTSTSTVSCTIPMITTMDSPSTRP